MINSQSVNRAWIAFFSIWILLLTGIFDGWFKSPGIKQWTQLHSIIAEHRQEIAAIEETAIRLKQIESQLENNSVAQEREIRKVLGYVAENEIVFEFEK